MSSEQFFQSALQIALSNHACVRVWRQPAGKIVSARGGAVKCAPVGAADLTGIVAPEGWRLEIEVKGARTRIRSEQRAWLARLRELGAVALLIRQQPGDVAAAVDVAVTEVLSAIAERRSQK